MPAIEQRHRVGHEMREVAVQERCGEDAREAEWIARMHAEAREVEPECPPEDVNQHEAGHEDRGQDERAAKARVRILGMVELGIGNVDLHVGCIFGAPAAVSMAVHRLEGAPMPRVFAFVAALVLTFAFAANAQDTSRATPAGTTFTAPSAWQVAPGDKSVTLQAPEGRLADRDRGRRCRGQCRRCGRCRLDSIQGGREAAPQGRLAAGGAQRLGRATQLPVRNVAQRATHRVRVRLARRQRVDRRRRG